MGDEEIRVSGHYFCSHRTVFAPDAFPVGSVDQELGFHPRTGFAVCPFGVGTDAT